MSFSSPSSVTRQNFQSIPAFSAEVALKKSVMCDSSIAIPTPIKPMSNVPSFMSPVIPNSLNFFPTLLHPHINPMCVVLPPMSLVPVMTSRSTMLPTVPSSLDFLPILRRSLPNPTHFSNVLVYDTSAVYERSVRRKTKPSLPEVRTTTGETAQKKPFICDYPGCGKGVASRQNLAYHKFLHKPEKKWPYGCKTCGKRFYKKYLFTQHSDSHSSFQPYKLTMRLRHQDPLDYPLRYQCTQCDYANRNQQLVDDHFKKKHSSDLTLTEIRK